MEWLNYHHLQYFHVVAREGGLGPASRILRLSRPTLSAQIKTLEENLGAELFARKGRRLVLTDVGRTVARYAEEIFGLGSELLDTVKGRVVAPRLDVGVADVVTKLVVRRILEPALHLPQPVHLVCHEESHERLLTRLAAQELDVMIADAPVPAGSSVRAFNHLLGECGVTFFGTTKHVGLRRGFPQSLDGAPVLLPIAGTPLRRALDEWLTRMAIRPRVVAEFEDSALLKVFGGDGLGVFAAPSAVERAVAKQYGVKTIGRVDEVRERFYLISAARRIFHPAVVAIREGARAELFA